MRLLAVNMMLKNRNYFQILCTAAQSSLERHLERTARNTMWAGEVQMQALSAALSRPIYSYIEFESDSKNRQYIPSNISLKQLLDRFHEKTAGGHMKYIGYTSDENKLGFCIFYNGIHFDALLSFESKPQQFVPNFEPIEGRL